MGVIIRKFEEQDIPAVMKLLDEGRPYTMAHHKYSYWMLANYLSDLSFVAVEDGNVVGYIGCLASPDKNCSFVWQAAVAPWGRGKGIGSQLLDRVVEATRAAGYAGIQCSVNKDNLASNGMFARCADRAGSRLETIGSYKDADFEEAVLEIKL